MAIPPDTHGTPESRREQTTLALGSTGPLLFSMLLTSVYALSQHECGRPLAWASLALTVLGMLLTLAASYALIRLQRAHHDSVGPDASRMRFMIGVGLGLNVISVLLLLGFLMPLLSLRPCE